MLKSCNRTYARMENAMSNKKARIMSRDSFIASFVQAEMIMRQKLWSQIEDLITKEVNEDVKIGLRQAQEIVFGKRTDELG